MTYKILAISGSLEKNAPSSGLIRACLILNNKNLEIEVADISGFPLFNMDTVIEKGYPPQIQQFRQKVSFSHGLLFSVAEHNGKVSAVLKNAYDWISFTSNNETQPPVKYLTCALMVCSQSGEFTAVDHITRIFEYCRVKPMKQMLEIKCNSQNFDHQGNLINLVVMKQISSFLNDFAICIRTITDGN